jgi:hypothetical protein
MSTSPDDRRLLRYLHGELSPAATRRLQAEAGRDPVLAARLARLQSTWEGLRAAAPVPEAPPAGTGARLARAAWRAHRVGPAPPWARPLVAGALAAGVALGVWLGRPSPPMPAAEVSSLSATGQPARPPAVANVSDERAGAPTDGDREPAAPLQEGAPEPEPATAELVAADPGDSELWVDEALRVDEISTDSAPAEMVVAYRQAGSYGLGGHAALAGQVTLAEAYLAAVEDGEVW